MDYSQKYHEAIIPQDVFDLVQAKMTGRKRQTEQGEYSMFAGLLRCAECGGALTLKKTHTKDQHEVYTCSTYIHKGKAHCTQHRVDADDLYDAVLIRIQECAKAVTGDGTELKKPGEGVMRRRRYTGTQRQSGEAGIKTERPPGDIRPVDCKTV